MAEGGEWGYGLWGYSWWGAPAAFGINDAQSVWDSPIDLSRQSNMYKLMRALLSQPERVTKETEEIYDQQHIQSATGDELEQFGELVKVQRKQGESDSKYRKRIKAAFRSSTMGATYDEFVEYASVVLGTDVSNIGFITDYANDSATVEVDVDDSVFNASQLTVTEAVNILGEGVPAGHRVKVTREGTFKLKSDGDADTASEGLTSDTTTDGGTLATVLVS